MTANRGRDASRPAGNGKNMKFKTALLAAALAMASFAQPAAAATFRFAFQGDLNSLDP